MEKTLHLFFDATENDRYLDITDNLEEYVTALINDDPSRKERYLNSIATYKNITFPLDNDDDRIEFACVVLDVEHTEAHTLKELTARFVEIY